MPKLSELKSDQVKVVSAAPKRLSQVSPDQVKVVDSPAGTAPTPQEPSTLDKLGSFLKESIGKPAAEALGTVTAPLVELDKVTGAPVRAAVGAGQRGEGLGGALDAAAAQLEAGLPKPGDVGLEAGQILPTTPTGTEIAFQGMTGAGMPAPFAATAAPFAGALTEAALDATNFVPSGAVRSAAKGAAKAAGEGLALAGKGLGKAEQAAASAIAQTGQSVTGGALKADKALQMYKELGAWEMIKPGSLDGGRLAKQAERVGAFREMLRSTPIEVPGSHDVAMEVKALVDEAEYRSGRTPGSERLLQMIKERAFEKQVIVDPPRVEVVQDALGNAVERPVPAQAREALVPRDLTLDELDDLVREADDLAFTPLGNPRSQPIKWGPTVKKSRAMLDEVMQTIPPGQMFKEEKQRFAALSTAGKERSKLVEAGADVAAMAGAITKNPLALVAQAVTPKAFVGTLAVLKVPRDMAEALQAAHQTGRIAVMRDALTQFIGKYPEATERVARGLTLLTGKPAGQQYLTGDEAKDLYKIRIFDPEQVITEKQRIQNDPSMSSTQKARKLSEINRNGYITYDPPEAPQAQPQQPAPPTLDDVERALRRSIPAE